MTEATIPLRTAVNKKLARLSVEFYGLCLQSVFIRDIDEMGVARL